MPMQWHSSPGHVHFKASTTNFSSSHLKRKKRVAVSFGLQWYKVTTVQVSITLCMKNGQGSSLPADPIGYSSSLFMQ